MNRGFTLLEVLVALAILSTVALLAVRVSGDSLTQLAETGWEDGVLRAGRAKMLQMLRESPDSLEQWGTLSPEYPDVEWHSKLVALRCMEGKRLEFRLVENRGTSYRELLLEYVLPGAAAGIHPPAITRHRRACAALRSWNCSSP